MLPLAADADVDGRIVRGRRRREPNIDLVRVQEAGLRTSSDPDILEWAAREGKVLITQDENTMTGHAWDRVRAGLPMAGVLVRGQSVTIRQAIDDLILVAHCGRPRTSTIKFSSCLCKRLPFTGCRPEKIQ